MNPSGVWIEDLQPDLLEAVNLCEGISGGAFRIRYFRPLWGAKLPVLVPTDNRSLTRFFQAKTIPTPLWTAVEQVLNFFLSPVTFLERRTPPRISCRA